MTTTLSFQGQEKELLPLVLGGGTLTLTLWCYQWRHRGGELEEERVREAVEELGEAMKERSSPRKKATRGAGAGPSTSSSNVQVVVLPSSEVLARGGRCAPRTPSPAPVEGDEEESAPLSVMKFVFGKVRGLFRGA